MELFSMIVRRLCHGIHSYPRHVSIYIYIYIYTKGFDDAALFQRLLLLANLYSPEQWKANALKPAALLGDKSFAHGHPDFDESMLNSQWPIYIMGGQYTLENRKAIKQKLKKTAKCELYAYSEL